MFYHISSLLISQVKISFNYFNRYVLGGITRLWSSLTDPRRKKKNFENIPEKQYFHGSIVLIKMKDRIQFI